MKMKANAVKPVMLLIGSALLLMQMGGCDAQSAEAESARAENPSDQSTASSEVDSEMPEGTQRTETETADKTDPASSASGGASSDIRDASGRESDSVDWRETAMHMRLIDDLDRPQDGWCLDAVGSGPHIRFDMPLIGHNCKPGLYADEAVEFTDEGQIRFPAYPGACVTVMGLNQYALPGASLMLKKCGERIPFLNAPMFQTFELLEDGMVRLKGSGLCITVGDQSERTFDATHAWRTLYVERCEECETTRAAWKFVRP